MRSFFRSRLGISHSFVAFPRLLNSLSNEASLGLSGSLPWFTGSLGLPVYSSNRKPTVHRLPYLTVPLIW